MNDNTNTETIHGQCDQCGIVELEAYYMAFSGDIVGECVLVMYLCPHCGEHGYEVAS